MPYTAIEMLYRRLGEGITRCRMYADHTDNQGLKKLLSSIIEQEVENRDQLKDQRDALALNAPPTGSGAAALTPDIIPEKSDDIRRLLSLLEEKKGLLEAFGKAAQQCPAGDLRQLLQKITDDERKQYSWLKDRYDLETLR